MSMHIQLCHREWVLWGYGPRRPDEPRFACMISPGLLLLPQGGGWNKRLEFRLPVSHATIHERVTMWGWRFRGTSEASAIKWQLADTREACLEQARKMVDNALEHSPERGRLFSRGLGDVREYAEGLT